jgi:secreted trypsin-like serine protease
MASLKILGSLEHICAGVIISNNHILSVAHCIYDKIGFYPFIRVFVGISNTLDTSRTPFLVQIVYVHPDYNGEKTGTNGYHNDIAIYKVSEKFIIYIK